MHAGFATTLLDSAMGTAFVSLAEAGTRWTTLELKANFTRAITAETGPVRCVGTVVHRGRTVVTTEARLEDDDGRLLAHGTSTILVLVARGTRLTSVPRPARPRRKRPVRARSLDSSAMDPLYDPHGVERALAGDLGGRGPLRGRRRARAATRRS